MEVSTLPSPTELSAVPAETATPDAAAPLSPEAQLLQDAHAFLEMKIKADLAIPVGNIEIETGLRQGHKEAEPSHAFHVVVHPPEESADPQGHATFKLHYAEVADAVQKALQTLPSVANEKWDRFSFRDDKGVDTYRNDLTLHPAVILGEMQQHYHAMRQSAEQAVEAMAMTPAPEVTAASSSAEMTAPSAARENPKAPTLVDPARIDPMRIDPMRTEEAPAEIRHTDQVTQRRASTEVEKGGRAA